MRDELTAILDASTAFHADLAPLWEEVGDPGSKRDLVVIGFCRIVRTHVISQQMLLYAGMDVSAMTLVRPSYEALVRAIWCAKGASDDWIEKFLSPPAPDATKDAEKVKGPFVGTMLKTISEHHPAWIHQELSQLKARTWKTMHSYVHGGIHAVIQSVSPAEDAQMRAVVLNGNGMAILATNLIP